MLTEKFGINYFYSSGQMWLKFDSTTVSQNILAYSSQFTLSASVAAGVTEAHVWTEGSSLMNCCSSQELSDGTFFKFLFKNEYSGLPWWRSGWESACRCRGHGFEPWSGKIPHAAEQLGPWATTTEPVRLEPVLCNKRGRDSERPTHRDEEWTPFAATRESPCTETRTQHSQK